MEHVKMDDYATLANAIFGGGAPGVPGSSVTSVVSWDVRWHGVAARGQTRDAGVGFVLDWQKTDAHIDWSMESDDLTFKTDPTGQTVITAFIGRERNGVFFS
ncbi:MAG TPA: hypothetical protein VEU77_07545 [Candidatus Acidoferrales bacterium]|nr:hypothetical protein [Candidatus Acidoferrales bacterium]